MEPTARLATVMLALLVAGCGGPVPPASDDTPTESLPARPVETADPSPSAWPAANSTAASSTTPQQPSTGGGVHFLPAATTLGDCPPLRGVDCFEPTAVADPQGRLFSSPSKGTVFMASLDGGLTWEPRDAPPEQSQALPLGLTFGDNSLQMDPEGRLWFSRLAYPDNNFGQNAGGFQASRSDDGGHTWAVDHSFAIDSSPDPVVSADRQWLAFGDGGTVYAQFWQFVGGVSGVLWLAASHDGGETFGPFVRTPGILTGPGLADAGGFHLAYFTLGSGYTVQMATTADDGETWSTETVYAAPADQSSGPYELFSTLDAAGTMHVAWEEADGDVLVASGKPGHWGAPVRWNSAPAVDASPAVRAHDGVLDALWYEESSDGQDVVFGWAPLDAVQDGPVQRVVLEHLPKADKSTDFGWLHGLPDGRALATWTHHDLASASPSRRPAASAGA